MMLTHRIEATDGLSAVEWDVHVDFTRICVRLRPWRMNVLRRESTRHKFKATRGWRYLELERRSQRLTGMEVLIDRPPMPQSFKDAIHAHLLSVVLWQMDPATAEEALP
jgi:hypothetical protein